MSSNESPDVAAKEVADIESRAHDTSYLNNSIVKNLAWNNVNVTVKDRQTKKPKKLLSDINGYVEAGEIR
jgi:hypothetical protein